LSRGETELLGELGIFRRHAERFIFQPVAEHCRIIEFAAEVDAALRDLRIFLPFASVPRTTSH